MNLTELIATTVGIIGSNISFEREAYSNEDDVIYLRGRKRFAWIKYLKFC